MRERIIRNFEIKPIEHIEGYDIPEAHCDITNICAPYTPVTFYDCELRLDEADNKIRLGGDIVY